MYSHCAKMEATNEKKYTLKNKSSTSKNLNSGMKNWKYN